MRPQLIFIIICVLTFADVSTAGDGPCGLEVGLWASPASSCRLKERSWEGAFLDVGRRVWHMYESECAIRSAELKGKNCQMRLACEVEGEATVRRESFDIIDSKTIRHANKRNYTYCKN